MFDLFTTRARKVLEYAKSEAVKKGDDCVGTQHILIGLVKEGSGVGHHILTRNGLDTKYISEETDNITQRGSGASQNPTWTPRAKKAFEHAVESATELGHNYIGTEHLLLGLLKEGESIGIQVIMNRGVDPEELRKETLGLLGFFDKEYVLKPAEECQSIVVVEEGKEDVIGRYTPKTDELLFNRPLSIEEIQRIIRVIQR